jgi:hypothetical protein
VRLKLVRVYKLEDLALKLLACYHPALMFRVLRLAPSDLSKGSISSESYALLLVRQARDYSALCHTGWT